MNSEINIEFVDCGCYKVPTKGTSASAGYDLYVPSSGVIKPNETVVINLKFKMQLPEWVYASIVPRSGLSLKTKLRLPNSPATIDADYPNEVGLILENTGDTDFAYNIGDRLAQMIFLPYLSANFINKEKLSGNYERTHGFGSTGK